MQRFIQIAQIIGAVALVILCGVIGASVGYGNGGWAGAICLGMAGLIIGAALAAGGLSFILQMLRTFS